MSAKYDRQITLLNILSNGKRTTYDNLAFELCVSVKTIKKDVSELSLFFPINTYQGCGGGVELSCSFEMNNRILKRAQLEKIAAALCLAHKTCPDLEIVNILKLIDCTPDKKYYRACRGEEGKS